MREVPHRHVVAPWLAVQTHRDWWLALGVPAVVLAVALMWPHIGWWSLGVALAAYGCGYLAYERFQARRALTGAMARTLGRLAELGGASTPGHAERSSTVAVAVGRRVGLEDTALGPVEHAARAVHVGRVGLDRPAHARAGFDPITVAEWSAAILRRAPGWPGRPMRWPRCRPTRTTPCSGRCAVSSSRRRLRRGGVRERAGRRRGAGDGIGHRPGRLG